MSIRTIRWPLLLTGLLVLCVLLGGSLWVLQPAAPAAPSPEQRARLDRLTAARQRWMTARPHHYRLAIAQTDLGLRCQALVEIRDTAMVAVEQNTCQTPPATIDDLFQLIERHTTERLCGPNGCPCAASSSRRLRLRWDGGVTTEQLCASPIHWPQAGQRGTETVALIWSGCVRRTFFVITSSALSTTAGNDP